MIGFFCSLVAYGCSGPTTPYDDLRAGEIGFVSAVRDGDALVLDTGLSVRLSGIDAPRIASRDRDADPFGNEAKALLEAVALGRKAQLYYGGLMRDRYQRALAHVVVWDEAGAKIWLNGYIVRQGGARVRTWPDNTARVQALYDLEKDARTNKVGLWADEFYQVLSPQGAAASRAYFAIVEGRVSRLIETEDDQSHISFDTEQDTIEIQLGSILRKSNTRQDLNVTDRVRVRGRLRRDQSELQDQDAAAVLALDHWAQIEFLETQ
jgi:endonuclease YncB( thermonuclease family)